MKIIVSDFDNTFYTENYEHNIKLINEFVKKGNKFIIATGRPLFTLLPPIEGYDIKYEYLICNDGSTIYDKNLRLISAHNLDSDVASRIFDELKRDSNNTEIYIETPYKFSTNLNCIPNGLIAKPIDKNIAKTSVERLRKKYPEVFIYLSRSWINILNANVSKSTAINEVLELNKWRKEDVITIGDNNNDIAMNVDFKSYAVSDGVEELINISKYTVSSFEEMLKKESTQ